MYPLNDKDLDRLSQQAAEQYDVESAASAWEKLEQRLNKELPARKEKDRKRFLWFLLLLVLISGSGLVWTLSRNTEQAVAKKTNKPVINNQPESNIVSENPTTSRSDKPAPGIKPDSKQGKVAVTDRADISNDKKANILSINKTTTLSARPGSKITLDKQAKGKFNKTDRLLTQNNKDDQPAAKIKSTTAGENVPSQPGVTDRNDIAKKDDKLPPSNDITVPRSNLPVNSDKDVVAKKDNDAKKIISGKNNEPVTKNKQGGQNKLSKLSRFEIGLITDIDYSAVKSTRTSKPGYGIGLMVGYNLSKRWSVNSGFIFTKKNYGANGEDYHPPKHYWTNYVYLEGLTGYCEMWDIPLNIRYNFTTGKKLRWFGSTGLSTYIMQQQYYKYYFNSNNLPDIKDWENNSQENYWFSVLNISGGFEKTINRSFSLQAEPFLRIPLRGVGFGKMNITSYGAFITLKYSPWAKRLKE